MNAARLLLALSVSLTAFAPALAAPSPPSGGWGAVVSQSFDEKQQIHEARLANGLKILCREVHSSPVVSVGVWYRVGSRNETPGMTGYSHLLEHMMFKGTASLPPTAIGRLLMDNGAEFNATTSTDYTEYHEVIASDRYELAVKMGADRMANSLIDPAELAREATVVRSEMEGDYDDTADDLLNNTFYPTAFKVHPYGVPTIGRTTDIEAVTKRRDSLVRYYKQHYAPNNAFVVIVGDFDSYAAIRFCSKYFGVYPPAAIETHPIPVEPPQTVERLATLRRPGSAGHVLIGYHVPGMTDRDHCVLDVIARLLYDGTNTALDRALIQTGFASEVQVANQDRVDPGLFEISVATRAGVNNAAVEDAVETEIRKIEDAAPGTYDVEQARYSAASNALARVSTVGSRAKSIGKAEIEAAAVGGYKYLDTYGHRILAVTPSDIQRVASKYLVPENRTTAQFEPLPMPAGATRPQVASEHDFRSSSAGDPAQRAAVSRIIAAYAPPRLSLPTPPRAKTVRTVLDNGIVLVVQENHAKRGVVIRGRIRAGAMLDPVGKYGLADMTASMLSKGTVSMNALQFDDTLGGIGMGLQLYVGTEATDLYAVASDQNVSGAFEALNEVLRDATFPADEFEKLKWQKLGDLDAAMQDSGGTHGPGTRAEIAFYEALYPPQHPYWAPTIDADKAALESITLADLRQFYKAYYRPDTLILTVVGNVDASAVASAAKDALGGWSAPNTPAPPSAVPAAPMPTTAPPQHAIVMNGASQTSILWGHATTLRRTDKQYYAASILSYILGGNPFDSRLGSAIRDNNGLAYTVSADFDARHGAGPFTVFVGTNPRNANRAIRLINQIIADVHDNGVTPQELAQAKQALTGSYPIYLETNSAKCEQLLEAEDFSLGTDYPYRRNALIESVTLADVNAAAKAYLAPDKAQTVVSGAEVVEAL